MRLSYIEQALKVEAELDQAFQVETEPAVLKEQETRVVQHLEGRKATTQLISILVRPADSKLPEVWLSPTI